MNNIYENFINLYPVSKTLRFELIPQGKTLENMKKNEILQNDEYKAKCYTKVKKIIDNYHKEFIDNCLRKFDLDIEILNKYYELKKNKNRDDLELKKAEDKLRKDISNCFTKSDEYKKIFSKELITQILPELYKNTEDMKEIEEFTHFTTYFTGFNENRKNIYTGEEKATSIAYRLINENLPIFISNMEAYKKIKENFPIETINEIYKNLEELMQVNYLDEMFEIDYFNEVLTQKGIEVYNQIIGGYSKADGSKIKGINEYVNEFRQKNPDKAKKVAILDVLYKQILSDKNTASFVIDAVEDEQGLLDIISNLSENLNRNVFKLEDNLENLLKDINSYNLEKIYVKNDLSITEISQYLYDDWSVISNSIKSDYDKTFGIPTTEKKEEEKKKYLKSKKYLSLKYINDCLQQNEKNINIEEYFIESSIKNDKGEKVNIFRNVEEKYQAIKELLSNPYPENKNLKEDTKNIAIIKDYLDSLKDVQLLIKTLIGAKFSSDYEKDTIFYEKLNKFWENMEDITSVYNKARNYLTGKPYSTNKIKLNFNNVTLLDGWDINREQENKSIILRKNGLYYLAIYNKNSKIVLEKKETSTNKDYEKMEYKQLPGPNKMLPKVFFAKRNIEEFKPSDELLDKYKNGYHKKGDNFDINFCHELIDYFKDCISKHKDWSKFDFNFSDTKTYNDISEFYKEIETQGYKITFSGINSELIDELVENGDIYLFQLYNKDFSEHSHGTPNLHTLYWKSVFSKENLEDVVYKLNGQAEIFYRKASIERKITHPKCQKIENKNENNPNKYSEFNYDLLKDKRFSEDKFQFHVPITMNFKGKGINNINEQVNKAIKENEENYVIGIDRGERNLLYLVLIDSKGNIIEQRTLNAIKNECNNVEYKTDYHSLLDRKEKEREKARESWQTIENIKNLKEGYLSQVINQITDLMIKYNAIVVLEDLNFGFMRGRQKVEKQVYQKFEKMLIDKLNYLVKKDKKIDEAGGLLKAYQLTNKFESFKKMGKQSGMLYYIPAWNTSKMDPVTGFVNFFYIKYESEAKAKEFIEKIDDIRYNNDKKYFEFDIDYTKFTTKAEGTKTKWTLCSYGQRIKTFRNKDKDNRWDNEEIDLTCEFKNLLNENNIDINSKNLKEDILEINGKDFWEKFINLFKLMVQMRNSFTGTDIDYIISPVLDKNGKFFDSRENNENLPKDADANGAYNIARKGLWAIQQIKNTPDDKLKKVKLAISNKEWLQFVQEENDS